MDRWRLQPLRHQLERRNCSAVCYQCHSIKPNVNPGVYIDQMITEPTRLTETKANILEFFFTSNPDCVESGIRLFADNCILYRCIKNQKDCDTLQQDLNNLAARENCISSGKVQRHQGHQSTEINLFILYFERTHTEHGGLHTIPLSGATVQHVLESPHGPGC